MSLQLDQPISCLETQATQNEKVGKLCWEMVLKVVASIPSGYWMSYGDVAEASGGKRSAGRAVGHFLIRTAKVPDSVTRVLKRTELYLLSGLARLVEQLNAGNLWRMKAYYLMKMEGQMKLGGLDSTKSNYELFSNSWHESGL